MCSMTPCIFSGITYVLCSSTSATYACQCECPSREMSPLEVLLRIFMMVQRSTFNVDVKLGLPHCGSKNAASIRDL